MLGLLRCCPRMPCPALPASSLCPFSSRPAAHQCRRMDLNERGDFTVMPSDLSR